MMVPPNRRPANAEDRPKLLKPPVVLTPTEPRGAKLRKFVERGAKPGLGANPPFERKPELGANPDLGAKLPLERKPPLGAKPELE
ncbi:MAG TPA: hypothetical protein VFB79_16910 [Candidatus Angelobacter sp.]|nr:hypothetical protein [Candidatus Angelobacter sp.]